MDTRNIVYAVVFTLYPLVVVILPIRVLKGTNRERLIWFYPTIFCILAMTWDTYLFRETTRFADDPGPRAGVAIAIALGITLVMATIAHFVEHGVSVVSMKKPLSEWGYAECFKPTDAAKLANPPAGIKTDADELSKIKLPQNIEFRGAAWVPVLLLAMAYNAASERQYGWDPGLRAALYLAFFFVCTPMMTMPFITDPLLVPDKLKWQAWDIFTTVVFEVAVCQYNAQMLTLYGRLIIKEDVPNNRWHDLSTATFALFAGLVAYRFLCYFLLRDCCWRRVITARCIADRSKAGHVDGGSQLEQTPLLRESMPLITNTSVAVDNIDNRPVMLMK